MAGRGGKRQGGRDRGQTLIDYSIGIGVFMAVLLFVFSFTPTLLAPFDSPQESASTAVADRTAEFLVTDLLAVDDQKNVLNATCTRAFFDMDTSVCGFDFDTSTEADFIRDAAGVSDRSTVNVTVSRADSVRTLDPGAVRLALGPDPPDGSGAVVANRAVLLEGKQHRLTVRVW